MFFFFFFLFFLEQEPSPDADGGARHRRLGTARRARNGRPVQKTGRRSARLLKKGKKQQPPAIAKKKNENEIKKKQQTKPSHSVAGRFFLLCFVVEQPFYLVLPSFTKFYLVLPSFCFGSIGFFFHCSVVSIGPHEAQAELEIDF